MNPQLTTNASALELFIPLLVFGVSVISVLYPQYLAWRWGKPSKHWPTTMGRIIYSKLTKYSAHKGGTSYALKVEYEYTVDEKRYTCTRIEFGVKLYMGKTEAQKAIAAYGVGRRVTVYYNPTNPKLATLAKGVSNGRLIFGFAMSALCAGLVVIGIVVLKGH